MYYDFPFILYTNNYYIKLPIPSSKTKISYNISHETRGVDFSNCCCSAGFPARHSRLASNALLHRMDDTWRSWVFFILPFLSWHDGQATRDVHLLDVEFPKPDVTSTRVFWWSKVAKLPLFQSLSFQRRSSLFSS